MSHRLKATEAHSLHRRLRVRTVARQSGSSNTNRHAKPGLKGGDRTPRLMAPDTRRVFLKEATWDAVGDVVERVASSALAVEHAVIALATGNPELAWERVYVQRYACTEAPLSMEVTRRDVE